MRAKLTRKFVDTGYDATPMVPCSELNDIFDLQGLPGAVFCSREEEAVAVGAGMHIAGRQPLVLMQSSGLMSSLNDGRLASRGLCAASHPPRCHAWWRR